MRKFFAVLIWTILAICMIVFAGAFVEICYYKGMHPDIYVYQAILQNPIPTIGGLASIIISWLIIRMMVIYN